MTEQQVAQEFARRYEEFWRDGARDVSRVYTQDAILCGYEIVKSADAIAQILGI
jgi:hypothetical protein